MKLSVVENDGSAKVTAEPFVALNELTVRVVVPPTSSSTGPPVPVWSPESSSLSVTMNSKTVELLSFAVTLKSFSPYTPDPTFFENIVWCEPVMSTLPIEVVDDWASEKEYFNYKTRKCIKNCCDFVDCCPDECGHYTQIIWRDTKEVGCAVSKLGSKQIWVCQYNPPANYIGEKTY